MNIKQHSRKISARMSVELKPIPPSESVMGGKPTIYAPKNSTK